MTFSPRVVDIYGFCGQSVVNERADGRDLTKMITRPWSSKKKAQVGAEERLRWARDVAGSIADLQTGADVSGTAAIVHRDAGPSNFVVAKGRLKLNDFNQAIFLKWDRKKEEICPYRQGVFCGNDGRLAIVSAS
uniref:Protein kinase domain-containing protein n=1 Tax=Corethron hystrix TaxID=216773 RepID=A0A7S1FRS2_9STRA|mmetsp:Transcript_22505/g.51530  ORF Transcript_22505/g.51530 Transcript_22505/m.51530 type:complete len:134 (+) Transcript_22505:273-674(+)